jgi:hypothetical protein
MKVGKTLAQPDGKDEPTDFATRRLGWWQFQVHTVCQPIVVFPRNRFAPIQDCFNALYLFDSKHALHFGKTVVVPKLGMPKPIFGIAVFLIAQIPCKSRNLGALRDNHATPPGRDLLVGIKGEDARASMYMRPAAIWAMEMMPQK